MLMESTTPRRAAFVALAFLSFLIGLPGPSGASCATPTEEGDWVNADPQTNSITRVRMRFVCQDQVLNGEPYPPGPPWYVHLFGKCHPTDCDWGEAGATPSSSGQIHGSYDQGFAKRFVHVKMSQYRPGQLWVHIRTDFADPNRPDYESHNWFVKQ